jgi:hypothetical protein
MAHRAHLLRGSDDGDDAFIPELRREGTKPGRENAVVVGDENFQNGELLASSLARSLTSLTSGPSAIGVFAATENGSGNGRDGRI